MYKYDFDTFVETKNLRTALNRARKQMAKLGLDDTWLDLTITKENENYFTKNEDYRLRIEKFGCESDAPCFYIDVAYNEF